MLYEGGQRWKSAPLTYTDMERGLRTKKEIIKLSQDPILRGLLIPKKRTCLCLRQSRKAHFTKKKFREFE